MQLFLTSHLPPDSSTYSPVSPTLFCLCVPFVIASLPPGMHCPNRQTISDLSSNQLFAFLIKAQLPDDIL